MLEHVSYRDTHSFSNLILDYLDQHKDLKEYYGQYPNIQNFKTQLDQKSSNYDDEHRITLTESLTSQCADLPKTAAVDKNIRLLKQHSTFTITTGHQLNLFTGPLYFFYKIVGAINLCKQLKTAYPANDFVPVFWMATEDHDFDEIQFFHIDDKKIVYDRDASGAVGRLDTRGLSEVSRVLDIALGQSPFKQELLDLFEKSYLKNLSLAKATRVLVHELFKHTGLVILDADDRDLKSLARPFFKKELTLQTSYQEVSKTLENWPDKYKIQVNPREINLFYLTADSRERLIRKDGQYFIDNTQLSFSEENLMDELDEHPEKFSPNVILRPLYQEILLPNLCYIGGGGELAYWLQLKEMFRSYNVSFPMLLLRNSVAVVPQTAFAKAEKLDLSIPDLFLPDHKLEEAVVRNVSSIAIDFSPQRTHLQKQFKSLYSLAEDTDASFVGAVAAQEKKQLNGLDHLEKRLLKAQKRKLNDQVERAVILKHTLFPSGKLQERHTNFSEIYKDYGPNFLENLLKKLDPLDQRFMVLSPD
jgi:bacillithiol biosynthesis cysteine-adding enzyme BshC